MDSRRPPLLEGRRQVDPSLEARPKKRRPYDFASNEINAGEEPEEADAWLAHVRRLTRYPGV